MLYKHLQIHTSAVKELNKLPSPILIEFRTLFDLLEQHKQLLPPTSKKLAGQRELFEIRLRRSGAWRVIYAHFKAQVYLLACFNKKDRKTRQHLLKTARQRLLAITQK